uniref:NADH-ubiquinone oxidoreductase chain 2 n=1 Tax=Colposcenia aliena TaxID=3101724 RepID=A0AAU8G5Y1_9HEMI
MLFYMIITPMYMLSIIMSISSYSWMMIWIGMEMNLIIFIIYNIKSMNVFSTESSMKYFLIQSLGSLIFIISLIVNIFLYEEWPNMYMYSIPLAMMLKSGLAPLHSWTPLVISSMSEINIFMFLTMQKIIPLMICFCSWMEMLMLTSVINVIMGAIGGVTQSSLIKMLIFSSLNNSAWMIMSMTESYTLFIFYFMCYSLMTMLIISMMFKSQTKWMIQVKKMMLKEKMSWYLIMLSMSGLPPFLGFFPKWLVLYGMFFYMPYFSMIFILSSVFTMFFYMKNSFSMLFMNEMNMKMNIYYMKFNMLNKTLITINCSGMIMFYILT